MKTISKFFIFMLFMLSTTAFAQITKVVGGGMFEFVIAPGAKVAVTISAKLINATTFEARGDARGVGLGTFPLNQKLTINCVNASPTAAIISGFSEGTLANGTVVTNAPFIFGIVDNGTPSKGKNDIFSVVANYAPNEQPLTCSDFPTPTSAADIAELMEVVFGLPDGDGVDFLNPLTGNITIK